MFIKYLHYCFDYCFGQHSAPFTLMTKKLIKWLHNIRDEYNNIYEIIKLFGLYNILNICLNQKLLIMLIIY